MPTTAIPLARSLNRFAEIFPKGAPQIPAALRGTQNDAPDLSKINLPLPSRKADYTCAAAGAGGTLWLGASTGLTRWNPDAPRKEDRVWYFSAPRYLPDDEVRAILPATPEGENEAEVLWVQTKTGAAKITLRWLGAEEKANLLLQESLDVVDRRGMFSQRYLSVPYQPKTAVPYNESDNDGCFGSGFSIAELLHYATLKRTLGAAHPETQRIRAVVTRAAEAQLLLLYIAGRGNGFPARTYLTPHEPMPDDGYFFRKRADGLAECLPTKSAIRTGRAGLTVDASAPVPPRLAKLYRDEGFTDAGLVYKADTSSDETTLHFAHIYFLHTILGEEDPELDALATQAAKDLLQHILDHGYELHDAFGEPTTWAKWSQRYFAFGSLGWYDSCLNAAELLMYIRVVMEVTGESEPWQGVYDQLIADGYADLTPLHQDRLHQSVTSLGIDESEDIMYGDHMLATMAFWPLIMLEPDENLRKTYQRGFASWRNSIGREFNPGYDLPFHIACPAEPVDWERLTHWFYRSPASRLCGGVNATDRHDMPIRVRWGQELETGWLLPDDERFIAKYDRNPNEYRNEEGGVRCVESAYVYTFAYWIGRYYGLFE
ncbi:MAG: hypothetical protein LBS96_00625 [Oscillospiraceae bacterium]|jgi:hypothetical protein|nr:hypothetical protein [Oscillospiraceae bacterium]